MDYLKINKKTWNDRLSSHVTSEFYDVEGFLNGKSSLNNIELQLLGDLRGKSILHLQCHFGQDTLSLAREGAHCTGMDFSEKAIRYARNLASKTGVKANFICCDVYDLPNQLKDTFDIVFTSYGTIGWLPDLERWAGVINRFLKPGGEFIMVEFHPAVWMFDDNFKKVAYSYFNTGPIVETYSGTYANRDTKMEHREICWNHSLSEVFQSLLHHRLEIVSFEEFDYSPYNCFSNTTEMEKGRFGIKNLEGYLPMTYAICAKKRADINPS